jgi:hypothetical protein
MVRHTVADLVLDAADPAASADYQQPSAKHGRLRGLDTFTGGDVRCCLSGFGAARSMSDILQQPPPSQPSINVSGNPDYRETAVREGFSWWKSLGTAAQFAMLTSAVMIGLASLGAMLAIKSYEKISAEAAASYEKINAEHRKSYEELQKSQADSFDRYQSDSAKSLAAMESAHRAEIQKMFATIENSVQRFEAVSMNQSALVQELLRRLIDREGMK